MFGSRARHTTNDSFSKNRAGKATSNSKSKRSVKESSFARRPAKLDLAPSKVHDGPYVRPPPEALKTPTITVAVGDPTLDKNNPRLFAAHEGVLALSPFFQAALREHYYSSDSKVLKLPTEVPEVFASVLQYLYQGDYYPKMVYDQRRDKWELENASQLSPQHNTVYMTPAVPTTPTPGFSAFSTPAVAAGAVILKDTAIYCTAERYGIPQLKRLALRKQGLQAAIPVSTILASAKYAYAGTPENDSKLRAHYLHLIIRSRDTFKRSGTMQMEMGMVSPSTSPMLGGRGGGGPMSPTQAQGTGLWFDLFVAMCNHLDDMERIVAKSPRP